MVGKRDSLTLITSLCYQPSVDLPSQLNSSLSLQATPTTLKPSTYLIHSRPFKNVVVAIPATVPILKSGVSVNFSTDRLTELLISIIVQRQSGSTQTKQETLSPTMSFFEEKWDPTVRKNLPPQVNAWRNGQVNTASSPGYTENARKAQSSASGATIVNGKIVRAVHAKPKENLPSNVHGFHNTEKAGQWVKQTTRPSTLASHMPPAGRPSSSALSNVSSSTVPGRSTGTAAYAGSTSRLSGPDFIPNAQSPAKDDTQSRGSSPSVARQSSSKTIPQRATQEQEIPSSTGHNSQTSSSEAHKVLPPHLRGLAATKTAANGSVNNRESESSGKMDAGRVSRPIKYESKFPCTYEKCTRGFMNKTAFNRHKEKEHDYCRVCEEDYEDGDKLFEHKMSSMNHICCGVCGQDFNSEGGRDKHVRQVRQIDTYV